MAWSHLFKKLYLEQIATSLSSVFCFFLDFGLLMVDYI